jgi:hypothetical protein
MPCQGGTASLLSGPIARQALDQLRGKRHALPSAMTRYERGAFPRIREFAPSTASWHRGEQEAAGR